MDGHSVQVPGRLNTLYRTNAARSAEWRTGRGGGSRGPRGEAEGA